MLKQTFFRPFGRLPHTTIFTPNSHQRLAGASVLIRTFRTTPAYHDEKRANVDTKLINDPPTPVVDAASSLEEKEPSTNSPKSSAPLDFDMEALRARFRDLSWQSISAVRQRTDEFTVNTAKSFSQLGAHLNKVTGYEEIESLKRRVIEQENKIEAAREAARQAKKTYDDAVLQRSGSQREVNDLLHRKAGWNDADRARFTTLVLQEHEYDQAESLAKATVIAAEDAVDREFSDLMRTILARYHDEQVWSDKIRSASTYGTMAAIALNLFVFISATLLIEPWKRRRMARMFEKKIEELNAQNAMVMETGMENLTAQFEAHGKALHDAVESASLKTSQASQAASAGLGVVAAPTVQSAPDHTGIRLVEVLNNREVVVTLALCAIVTSSIGWFARVFIG